MLRFAFITAALVGLALGNHDAYDGYKVYKVKPSSDEHFEVLQQVEELVPGVDFWIRPSALGRSAGFVMIPPEGQDVFEAALTLKKLAFEIDVTNVKDMLEIEDKRLEDSTRTPSSTRDGPLEYDRYHRYARIDAYLEYLGKTYPDRVEVVKAGKSFEGRDIKYLKVSTSDFQDTRKPVVFFDAGIHAREWISIPTVTYILYKLIEDVGEEDLVKYVDFVVLPLVNPDGYEYSHTDTRLWRKTTSKGHIIANVCTGVDGNRNFDFAWMEAGSSDRACFENFAGPKPFSETETEVVRDIIWRYLERMKLYVTFHSFGSYVLYPWGNNGSLPTNWAQLHEVGVLAGNAIDAASLPGSTKYLVGNSATSLGYAASGASEDYARSVGVPLAYTLELPGRRSGFQSGFELDPSDIDQVVKETWAGVTVFTTETLERHHRGEI